MKNKYTPPILCRFSINFIFLIDHRYILAWVNKGYRRNALNVCYFCLAVGMKCFELWLNFQQWKILVNGFWSGFSYRIHSNPNKTTPLPPQKKPASNLLRNLGCIAAIVNNLNIYYIIIWWSGACLHFTLPLHFVVHTTALHMNRTIGNCFPLGSNAKWEWLMDI